MTWAPIVAMMGWLMPTGSKLRDQGKRLSRRRRDEGQVSVRAGFTSTEAAKRAQGSDDSVASLPDAARVEAHVSALKRSTKHRPRPLRASALASLRLPDGAPLSGDLAAWLAYDGSSVPLVRGATKPTWALAAAEPLRPLLQGVGLRSGAPLVALEPAASYERFLALVPSRGNPVLAWDGAELWVERESFVEHLEVTFPAGLDAPSTPSSRKAAASTTRPTELSPTEVDALSTDALAQLARGLGEKANATLLKAPTFVEAVVRALARHGLHGQAYDVLRWHAAAWRGGLAANVFLPALELAASSSSADLRRFALAEYRAWARRDPSDLYFIGSAHVLALRCAEALGERDALLDVVEHVLTHTGEIPDSVPVADPSLAPLWARASLRGFRRELATLATKQARQAKQKPSSERARSTPAKGPSRPSKQRP